MIAQVRLIADSLVELEQAIEEIKSKHRTSGFELPGRPGRRGSWLTYGLLIVDELESKPEVILVDPATGEIMNSLSEHKSRPGHR